MKKGHFDLKAMDAIRKNFRSVRLSGPKVKAQAVLCSDHGLPRLAKSIGECKDSNLSVLTPKLVNLRCCPGA